MTRPLLTVAFPLDAGGRAVLAAALGEAAEVCVLPEHDPAARQAILRRTSVLLARNTGKELLPGEPALLAGVRLIQFMTAGVDYIPLRALPAEVPIASNGGAYAEPMAEHAVAMVLAAAKRLSIEQQAMAAGAFNQFVPNRMLAGGVCGILGFGGIGIATARLLRGFGMRIHAIRRSGRSEEPVDWIGTPDRLDEMLAAADVLVLSLPLTNATRGIIGARELGLMKPDAILVNLARGEVVDEDALYRHLVRQPAFVACIDAWWIEPVRHGAFRMDRPFLELPNVIASPHNSASVRGIGEVALTRAAINCRRVLEGLPAAYLIGADERAAAPEA
ncbi:NAD(P)-dependent oxidoreductase [Paeniroseomonas aquatica]|uniref:NAD(P)-dependent oxidoreductase n=1 Tax=Paeniroseomonas aquatica TaxID=373043 RepID=A0ABT8A849_9PROT|nr:NAD(P)-dependent oxidoreductase [Paeniroseomonas aquatica]MDN3565987.1 NAD(P)-dependent oxidoreductase [Paeniroseomonas aquatica]